MKKIDPKELERNAIKLIGEQWMLVTAGDTDNFNMMTASWGGLGELWFRPVAFIFIRPQRYTCEFLDRSETFTLSFFGEKWRNALQFCGSHSGRDHNKAAETGLTPYRTETGSVAFREAEIVLECRKIYKDDIKPEGFIDRSIPEAHYQTGDFHHVFVGEIVGAWIKG